MQTYIKQIDLAHNRARGDQYFAIIVKNGFDKMPTAALARPLVAVRTLCHRLIVYGQSIDWSPTKEAPPTGLDLSSP